MVPSPRAEGPHAEYRKACDTMEDEFEDTIDWGDDAESEVVASCDLSNPEICESCT